MKRIFLLIIPLLLLGGSFLLGRPQQQPQDRPARAAPAEWKVPAQAAFNKNPFASQEQHTRAGEKLFLRFCASCHGQAGGGKGKSPSLQSARVRETAAGSLFWFVRNGDLRNGMPGWARLPDQQIWQLVTFLQGKMAARLSEDIGTP
jgi:mono/diheme cytochrome c family protein